MPKLLSGPLIGVDEVATATCTVAGCMRGVDVTVEAIDNADCTFGTVTVVICCSFIDAMIDGCIG